MKNFLKTITKLSLLTIFAVSINAEYRLGKDYRLVDNPMPVKKDGIVEVTESFWYGCAHCYSFEPAINSWKATLGSDTKLIKMPITWGGPKATFRADNASDFDFKYLSVREIKSPS